MLSAKLKISKPFKSFILQNAAQRLKNVTIFCFALLYDLHLSTCELSTLISCQPFIDLNVKLPDNVHEYSLIYVDNNHQL